MVLHMAVSCFATVARSLAKQMGKHGYGCPLARLRKTLLCRTAPFGLAGFGTKLRLGNEICSRA